MEDVSGIDREDILTISKTFLKYHDDIKAIFLEYKNTVENTAKYYQGNVAESYRNKFKDFEQNLDVVLKSFLDYSETLVNVVKRYDEFSSNSSMIITNKEVK